MRHAKVLQDCLTTPRSGPRRARGKDPMTLLRRWPSRLASSRHHRARLYLGTVTPTLWDPK